MLAPDFLGYEEEALRSVLAERPDVVNHNIETVRGLHKRTRGAKVEAPTDRWAQPGEFRWFREQGEAMGFGSVLSGPLVPSSYRAGEQRHPAEPGRGAVAY